MEYTYKDIEEKLKYYKQKILKEFVEKGIFPDNELLKNRLKSFDVHLALFKHYDAVVGEKFNTDEYNESLKLIYEDLRILNKILFDISINEYIKQQNYINSYINELNSIVDTYKKRADFENDSTTFGKTLLFQNNNFTIQNDNSTSIINLNKIEVPNAAHLICISNINGIDPENMMFVFKNINTGEILTTPPYNFNNEILKIPGKLRESKFDFEIQKEQNTKTPVLIDIDTKLDVKNKYTILAGRNKIFLNYRDKNKYDIEEMPSTMASYVFEERTYINFYVYNGNSITFKFNKKPLSTNFPIDEQKITNLDPIHHFFLECDKDFCLEIELDKGEIYAIKENGIINNNNLYYTGTNLIKDFLIIEQQTGELQSYDVSLKIFNNNDKDIDIENIVIKQTE